MKRRYLFFISCQILGVALLYQFAFAQSGSNPVYIDTAVGNPLNQVSQFVNANKVESIIKNDGTFGAPGGTNSSISGVWPIGTGHGHVDQMSLMVGAQVIDMNGATVHIVTESYSGGMPKDLSPATGKQFGWNPLPGYHNKYRKQFNSRTLRWDSISTAQIASSPDPSTWPVQWPGKDATWDGTWNGYFGKNQFNADQEVVYVIDDSWNNEFLFYPFTKDSTRRGLGVQVETRMFQWAHPLAEDQIFIHYQISNAGDTLDYDRSNAPIYLGAFTDTHPGGSGDHDDMSGWDQGQNMVFAWDFDNGSISTWTKYTNELPGYIGWKYLESPGIKTDGIDNDNDGLIDESRDNDAGSLVFGSVGNYGPPKLHWSGDEDGDWVQATDDVGSDGLGVFDPNYVGPDADGTEGNGRPDQGEPNFGKTDNDESDQIGLTSFSSPEYNSNPIPQDDEALWSFIENSPSHHGVFTTPAQNANNIWIFASGPFDLKRKQTERFSVCWLFGVSSGEIYRNAFIAQRICDNDYRITMQPVAPTVKAVAGDKRVVLYWDDLAEISRDPFYGNDFEGYKIFRGTDPQLSDAQIITDGYGMPAYRLPIAQFDIKDGIKGFHPVALGEELGEQYSTGIHYFMGDDNGLQHYFIDMTVTNGLTYYYIIVSYDKGYYTGMDNRNFVPVSPLESPGGFKVENGVLIGQSRNAVVVTPNAPATNYVAGSVDYSLLRHSAGYASSAIHTQVVDPDQLPNNHVYEVSFDTTAGTTAVMDTTILIPFATNYTIRDTTSGTTIISKCPIPLLPALKDTQAVQPFEWQKYDTMWTSNVFNGMVLNFKNILPDTQAVRYASGWQPGSKSTSAVNIMPNGSKLYPVSFKIIFDSIAIGKSFTTIAIPNPTATTSTYFIIINTATGDTLPVYLKESLFGKNGKWDKTGELIYVGYRMQNGTYIWPWYLTLVLYNPADFPPQPGDVYNFVCPLPFTTSDKFTFTTSESKLDRSLSSSILDKVAVVPNPYLVTALWERESSLTGRGERKVQFIHLPAECTIRIFTQNGTPIRTINHSKSMADGIESWDLTTSEGLEVAFGVYIFYIDAKDLGQKIGTFAIIN